MKAQWIVPLMVIMLALNSSCTMHVETGVAEPGAAASVITLPDPRFESQTSLEAAILSRRSIREYSDVPLALGEVSQLLWAAQGITSERGFRTAPSAGALYPLELYLVAGSVDGLVDGVYQYIPDGHMLKMISDGDKRIELQKASLDQASVGDGSAVIVIAAEYERTTRKYGERGIRYVHMEVGHAAQNIYLQAVSLDLGVVFIGAFYEDDLKRVLSLPETYTPLGVVPVGKR